MTLTELSQYLDVSESTIRTNFPSFCASQAKKGKLIIKEGKYPNATYFIKDITPQNINKEKFSTARPKDTLELPNEQWITCLPEPNYEVSNLGRFRNKKTKTIFKGTIKNGYCRVSCGSKKAYALHRLILASFQPIDDWTEKTVDHINGIRTDNRIENLRWADEKENTLWMLSKRANLNKELTRIINKIGYDETLKVLQNIAN